MNSNSQDTVRSTLQNKYQWIESEDRELIEAMVDLHNTRKHTSDEGFKSGFFTTVERILSVTLPGFGLKAEPHIKSRVKTLKQNFAIVHDMLCGSNISGFGYNNMTKCVITERAVWDAYLQSHKKAYLFRDPFYKKLCTIFGKDRANGQYAESPTDAVESLDREATNPINDLEDDITCDDLEGMEFPMTGDQPIGVGVSDTDPKISTPRMNKKRKGPSIHNLIYGFLVERQNGNKLEGAWILGACFRVTYALYELVGYRLGTEKIRKRMLKLKYNFRDCYKSFDMQGGFYHIPGFTWDPSTELIEAKS